MYMQKKGGYMANKQAHLRKKLWQEEYDECVNLYEFGVVKG